MAKKIFKNIMFDLETLSTRADAVILSIGAVKFNLDAGGIDDNGFYSSVSIDSNHEVAPRHISESTLLFWMKQDDDARAVFTESKTTLNIALQDLAEWIDHGDYKVWGNGANFDIAILDHAYAMHGMESPWKFWNTGCHRTMKNLPGAPKSVTPPKIAHHALFDAISQAQHLQLIHRTLFQNERKAA